MNSRFAAPLRSSRRSLRFLVPSWFNEPELRESYFFER